MKKKISVVLLSIAVAIGLLLAPLLSQRGFILAQDEQIQVIELAAKKYEYSPAPVHVKAGSKVRLKITATDHDHGFKVAPVPDDTPPSGKPGLVFASAQDCWLLKKGETTTIDFIALIPGTYTFRCCHTCGLGHRGMKSEIIVDP
jgi:heme/copper-type cytochrome/quinol oxidase subunit 2